MSRLDRMAMIDTDGHVLYPDTLDDALHYAKTVGAWPVDAGRFPWTCGAFEDFAVQPDYGGAAERVSVRCGLVQGHEGRHSGRIGWEG